MKKSISLLLAALMIVAVAIPCFAATAAPKTYVASNKLQAFNNRKFKNSLGCVEDNFFTFKNGERVMFEPNWTRENDELNGVYVRSNVAYYGFDGWDNVDGSKDEYFYEICSSDLTVLSGKKRNVICKSKKYLEVIGGYGASVIFFQEDDNSVKKYHSGKITTLIKSIKNYKTLRIFNGKIFYDGTKVYDLKTGKTSSFKAKAIYTDDKCLYYINGNNNLKRYDKDGKISLVAKNVSALLYGSNSKVIFASKSGKNTTYYFKKIDSSSAVKLCDDSGIKSMLSKEYKSKISQYGINLNKSELLILDIPDFGSKVVLKMRLTCGFSTIGFDLSVGCNGKGLAVGNVKFWEDLPED